MQTIKADFETSSAKVEQCPKTEKPEFAFIGRSNVGKSSLINMLVDRKALAKTSGSPGKTKLINHFNINDLWYLVDLPGYGYAKVAKTERASFMKLIYTYFEERMNMVNAFLLIDCRIEPQKSDLDFMTWLGEHNVPFSLVFTKIDKLSSTALRKNIETYHKKLLETWESVPPSFMTSAASKHGREELLNYIDFCIGVYKEGKTK